MLGGFRSYDQGPFGGGGAHLCFVRRMLGVNPGGSSSGSSPLPNGSDVLATQASRC